MADLLTLKFPELSAALHAPAMLHSGYRQLDCFAAFTRRALREDHLAHQLMPHVPDLLPPPHH